METKLLQHSHDTDISRNTERQLYDRRSWKYEHKWPNLGVPQDFKEIRSSGVNKVSFLAGIAPFGAPWIYGYMRSH